MNGNDATDTLPATPVGLVGLRKLIRDTAADDGGGGDAYTYDIDDETCERIASAVLARLGVQS